MQWFYIERVCNSLIPRLCITLGHGNDAGVLDYPETLIVRRMKMASSPFHANQDLFLIQVLLLKRERKGRKRRRRRRGRKRRERRERERMGRKRGRKRRRRKSGKKMRERERREWTERREMMRTG